MSKASSVVASVTQQSRREFHSIGPVYPYRKQVQTAKVWSGDIEGHQWSDRRCRSLNTNERTSDGYNLNTSVRTAYHDDH